jgi:electron transport complex protein RnfG
MKNEVFKEYIKPFVVLVCICLVASFLLSYTNGVTAPIIEENDKIAAENTRSEVMPGATGFTEVECDTESLDVDSVYKENSGLGYVIASSHKGYGGLVTVTVGIDNDGCIVGIKANVSTETTGVGSKAGTTAYLSKYMGISGSAADIDTISNATYSSSAVKNGVNAALNAFDAIKEAK